MSQIESLLSRLVEQTEAIEQRLMTMVDAVDEIRHSVDWTNPGSGVARLLEILQQAPTSDKRRPYEWISKRCYVRRFTPWLDDVLNSLGADGWDVLTIVALPTTFGHEKKNEDEVLVVARRAVA